MHDGPLQFSAALTESTTATLRGLEGAKAKNARGGNVCRVVLTSSSWAVYTPTPGKAMKVGVETWNSEAVTAMRDAATPAAARGMLGVHG